MKAGDFTFHIERPQGLLGLSSQQNRNQKQYKLICACFVLDVMREEE
jgi:hypothetical protein